SHQSGADDADHATAGGCLHGTLLCKKRRAAVLCSKVPTLREENGQQLRKAGGGSHPHDSPPQNMIRDLDTLALLTESIGRFVRERLIPNEALVAETDVVPEPIIAEMKKLGLFGLSIPESYGGLGLTMEEEVEVAFVLGGTSPAFRSLIGTNNGIGSQGIILDGTAEQKARYLPRLASG